MWDCKLGSVTDVQEQQREYSGLWREAPKHFIPGHLSFLCGVKYTLCNNYINQKHYTVCIMKHGKSVST